MIRAITFATVASGLLTTTAAFAHHSVALFDLSDEGRQSISGTVVKWEWRNPHSWIFVEVAVGDDEVATYGMELSAPYHLRRAGLRYDSVAEGDEVTVEFAPDRSGRKSGLLTRIIWADGRTWAPSGRASPLPPPGGKAPGQDDRTTSTAPPLKNSPPE